MEKKLAIECIKFYIECCHAQNELEVKSIGNTTMKIAQKHNFLIIKNIYKQQNSVSHEEGNLFSTLLEDLISLQLNIRTK